MNYLDKSCIEIAGLVGGGDASSEQVTAAFVEQSQKQAHLNALTHLAAENALQAARARDAARARGERAGRRRAPEPAESAWCAPDAA